VTGLVGPKHLPFKMVLDHPPKNPTANQTDTVTRETILNSDPNASINWALTRNDPQVTEWIFPTAYHIKVIVQDGKRFWLSSGNMNNSNEPNTPALQKTGDRDWHVVLENNELAQLYKAFIDNDFNVAAGAQSAGNAVVHAQIDDAMQSLSAESSKSTFVQLVMTASTPPTNIPAKVFTDVQVAIQPLLTPDKGVHTSMYVDNVLNLINSAQKTLYMQTQYVHPSPKPGDADFMLLVAALSNAHKKGLDVRLITSQYENTAQWIETLKPFDLDQVLRIQNKVHNKGIVADSKVVMVSSQNWSADGCLRNRDAGLIIENADIAAYFESIFMNDWVNLATEKIVDASTPSNT
jgi:phosphatidylserine/phosphatidylglycerophosphate/cardiolipin synthase-like enzyme